MYKSSVMLFWQLLGGTQPAISLRKRSRHRCFPVIFKIFKNKFFTEHLHLTISSCQHVHFKAASMKSKNIESNCLRNTLFSILSLYIPDECVEFSNLEFLCQITPTAKSQISTTFPFAFLHHTRYIILRYLV